MAEQTEGKFWIKGMITATVSPFKQNGDVDFSKFDQYADYLVDMKIDNIFVNGTSGESISLTIGERKDIAEAWVKAAKGRLKCVIVHVGAGNLKDSIELAHHAEEIGADAIAAMCTSYFKPTTEEVLVEYMHQIAGAAPNLPFCYYDIGFMTGVHLETVRFLELAKTRIPTLHGVKDSSGQLSNSMNCAQVDGGKYQVIIGTFGDDFLPSLSVGQDCCVLIPYMAPLYLKIKAAVDARDLKTAQKDQLMALKIANIQRKYGSDIAMVKAMLSIFNHDFGPVRLPLVTFTDERKDALRRDLIEIGFLPEQESSLGEKLIDL